MRQGDVEKVRFDAFFHSPLFEELARKLAKVHTEKLGALVSFSAETWEPKTYKEETFRYVEISGVDAVSGEASWQITSTSEAPSRARMVIKAGDVIVSTTRPHHGSIALLPNDFKVSVASTGFAVLRSLTSDVLPDYLWHVLRAHFSLQQLLQRSSGGNYPAITQAELANVRLPLPPLPIQRELVAAMNAARTLRQQQLAEAEALLAGFDTYLLTTLGIATPAKDERRIFAVRTSEALAKGRINPEYFHPERLLTLRAIEEAGVAYARLGEVVDFVREQIKTPGKNYLSLGHVESQTGELVASSETSSGSCFLFEADDVLFMRLRPYLNKVHRAEAAGCCSPEFHVLRVRDEAIILPAYVAVALRSKLMLLQTVRMMTGNTHPRLANEDVPDLILPVPPLPIQREIVAEVQRRRTAARALRAAAETGWAAAKAAFEARLLGK